MSHAYCMSGRSTEFSEIKFYGSYGLWHFFFFMKYCRFKKKKRFPGAEDMYKKRLTGIVDEIHSVEITDAYSFSINYISWNKLYRHLTNY